MENLKRKSPIVIKILSPSLYYTCVRPSEYSLQFMDCYKHIYKLYSQSLKVML